MMKVIFSFLFLVLFSGNIFAEDAQAECAKWLLGDRMSNFETRREATLACSKGATVECAQWVLGDRYDSYQNRLEAVTACNKNHLSPM